MNIINSADQHSLLLKNNMGIRTFSIVPYFKYHLLVSSGGRVLLQGVEKMNQPKLFESVLVAKIVVWCSLGFPFVNERLGPEDKSGKRRLNLSRS